MMGLHNTLEGNAHALAADRNIRDVIDALEANDRLEKGGEFALQAKVSAQLAVAQAMLAVAAEIHQHGSI